MILMLNRTDNMGRCKLSVFTISGDIEAVIGTQDLPLYIPGTEAHGRCNITFLLYFLLDFYVSILTVFVSIIQTMPYILDLILLFSLLFTFMSLQLSFFCLICIFFC